MKTLKCKSRVVLLLLFAGIFLGACKKESNLLSASAEGVQNHPDNLSIGYHGLEKVTDHKTYTYNCTTRQNTLGLGGWIRKGSVNVKIRNTFGTEIYSKTINGTAGERVTLIDSVGAWTVDVEFDNAKGDFSLSLAKED